MVFYRTKIKDVGLPVVMQRNEIECAPRTMFLGEIIDNKLKWNDHTTYLKCKISKTIGFSTKCVNILGGKLRWIYIIVLFSHISSTVMRYGVMLLLFILIL